MTSQFANMALSSIFFDIDVNFFWRVSLVKFSYWSKFMSMPSLVLELWQFLFIKVWPEIRKLEIPPSEFCPISGDWGELVIPNLVGMFLMKCYRVLRNARVTAFTVSELLRENQQGVNLPPHSNNLSAVVDELFECVWTFFGVGT